LQVKKIVSLLDEQNRIFDHMPDGLIMHQVKDIEDRKKAPTAKVINTPNKIQVNYINKTFYQIFLKQLQNKISHEESEMLPNIQINTQF
jgi:hypothetical protein